jgi:hypothetical protein
MNDKTFFVLGMMAGAVWFCAYYLSKIANTPGAILETLKKPG